MPRLATVLTAGYRDTQYAELERAQRKNPPQRSDTAAHQVDTGHRGRLVTPAVREPVNATDIGELTPRLT